jgi:mannose-1-phosphate guanylyltransferase
MMTQELIHPADLIAAPRGFTASIQAPATVARMETNRGRVSARANHYPRVAPSNGLTEVPRRHRIPALPASNRWGIVLAGGDGVRLRDLTQWVWGADRPKQFCALLSNRTLLEETRDRAERSVPPDQILYSVTQAHERYYIPSLADRPSQRIVQPSNKGTAPAILCALIQVAKTDPNAIVIILPCDHYYCPESSFTSALESACEIAEQRLRSVVLLGVEPKSPEVDYGWIEIGETIDGHSGLSQVVGFKEKPPLPVAETLFRAGSLWNTFVMVGHVCSFLEMAWATVPSLLQALESRETVSSASGEIRIPDAVYCRITSMDFSRQVLSSAIDRLLALPLANVAWSDLGDPYRVLATLLEKNGDLPSWARLWPGAQQPSDALTLS